jgi:hypothetical protein
MSAMSEDRKAYLIEDLNEKIIAEFIHDYPTFRRFLITIGEDQEQVTYYIRKYLKKFITRSYVRSFIQNFEFEDLDNNYKGYVWKTPLGVSEKMLSVASEVEPIPFFDDVTHLSLPHYVQTVENLRSYSNIEFVEIHNMTNLSPEEFVRTFPKLRTLKCGNAYFLHRLLAISTTIKEVEFSAHCGMTSVLPLKYPKINFVGKYNTVELLENSEIPNEPRVENLKCALSGSAWDICFYDPKNANIESLHINSYNDGPIVIPKHYKDLRFLRITFVYANHKNVDIVIDGFPCLEFVEIYSCLPNRSTCRIANVPYIFTLKVSRQFDLDIDYETVSIFEHRN